MGEIDFTKQTGDNILELLIASDELLLEELFKCAQDYLIHLIEKQQNWFRRNFIFIVNTVFKLTGCKKLQDYCLESICADPLPFITSKNFPSLDEDVLYCLLKRDDLHVEEIVAWDCLIKWGIEQTGLSNNRAKWDNEDYEALKKTLNQLIPLIRFIELYPDFFDKIRPYKAIIPINIYKEVEESYHKGTLPKNTFLSPRAGKIKSEIIKPKVAKIIINWIDKKNSNYNRNVIDSQYRFNLIYRGSRDGINNLSFKENCKGLVASLVLIKVQQSNKIFGGYSSIGFNSNDIIINNNNDNDNNNNYYCFSKNNFIFSFENSEDIKNMKLSRVKNFSKAIYCGASGFNFGHGSLYMNNQKLYANNSHGNYERYLNIDYSHNYFNIKEIETFLVIKR
ncbi:uncharacterized protein OCT59_005976 [Rhizophagus irregularis]|uniref:uncharacterized protein n=1 Tax=Rhizophagus irregularis TaxID=588596 RepID=UPI00332577A9|nr:hypothetical protein OCT59_005976 [Rhizophagus irregularis]